MSGSASSDPMLPAPAQLAKDFQNRLLRITGLSDLLGFLFPKKSSKRLQLNTSDSVAILFFMALGMMTRFFRIQFPSNVVFDEVHFGNFTNWYLKGEYFHDIHPPLAKLIMAGVAKYAGYDASIDFAKKDKFSNMIYVSLRSTPAFFGALCVPLSYVAMRAMNCRQFAAAVAAVMVMCDLSLVVEARHILSDGILHCFACLAILSIFLYERFPCLGALVFEGLCLGCVAACKYTAGGIVLLAFVRQFELRRLFESRPDFIASVLRCVILGCIITAVHIACFWVHLTVLPYIPRENAPMPDCVRKGLVDKNNPNWDARNNAPSMLRRILTLIVYMHVGNMGIRGGHPYRSSWWEWPLALGKWVLYWTENGKHIICLGHVLIWYPVFFGIVWNLVRMLFTGDYDSEESAATFGWILSYLPFALIPRDMFLYHYAIPLIFGIYNLGLVLERHLPGKQRGFLLCAVLCMALFGFVLWCPWVYGLTTPDFFFLVWNKRWR